MSLESYLRAAPKAELHVHLTGAIQPATLLALARKNGVQLPVQSLEEMKDWFLFRDFPHFIQVYSKISPCLKSNEDFELIVYELGSEMARQNIRYAEVTISACAHHHYGVPFDVYFDGLTCGRKRVKQEFNADIRWVFDIVRSIPDATLLDPYAQYTVEVAIEGQRDGVVALGLGGYEVGYPPEKFERWFDQGRKAGLHSTPHAGETGGPDSVWGAINRLGAERIGHGVRSVEDPRLVEHLVENGIPLEVCPTSNIRLGIYPSLQEHPLRRLHEAGVAVTVNSDDPPLFNTTLNDEVLMLADAFGFDQPAIDEILLNGVRHSFLPPEEKSLLEKECQAQMRGLKEAHLT